MEYKHFRENERGLAQFLASCIVESYRLSLLITVLLYKPSAKFTK